MSIEKIIISEDESSPYSGYPQMGDIVYLISNRDNQLSIIDWCKENCNEPYLIFLHYEDSKEGMGIWLSAQNERISFEQEWM